MIRNMGLRLAIGVFGFGAVGTTTVASAGGLFLPGAGAVSSSRAGASTAASDDGEAIVLNPANLAKAKGTTITLSAAIISYAMKFARSGTYDPIAETDVPYENQPFPVVTNKPKPPLGVGSWQPVPVVAVISDLGGKIEGLHVAAGIYAPNAYPFRDMSQGYHFCSDVTHAASTCPDLQKPPPATRYDIITQEAAVILPSVAVAYSVTKQLDLGARFSAGFANLKSTTAIWGQANFEEWVESDGIINISAKDNFVPAFGFGATFRPTPEIEVAANWASQIDIHAKGTATAQNGPNVAVAMQVPVIGPPPDGAPTICAAGGTFAAQKACVDLSLPMNAQLGGRYKFLDANGKLRGDIELDLDYEHWGTEAVSNYHVNVDATAYIMSGGQLTDAVTLNPSIIRHGLQDTFGARLGGSYIVPIDATSELVLRGGLAFDTRAAKDGWLRADLDGASRTTVAVGVGYKLPKWEINAGFGAVLEGTQTNPGSCNPAGTIGNQGCDGTGNPTPVDQRHGWDPVTPIVVAGNQFQSPVNQGSITSHYLELMLGATTHF